MTSTFFSKTGSFLRRQGRALRLARKGNVAMIFALAVVPLVVAGGSGIDLARSLAVRGKLYSAVDAAALAVASKVGITQAQATVLAQQYFDANYNLDGSFGVPDPVSVTITGQRVTVTSDIDMPTTLMNIAGIQDVNLTASSEVVWGQTKIWVGLALDNTGSMCAPGGSPCPVPAANSKLYALKEGTKGMLTLFENVSANPGDVRVSVIPFSKTVNVGTSNVNATWIDWTDWDSPPPNATDVVAGNWSQYGPQGTYTGCPWGNNTSNNGYRCQVGAIVGANANSLNGSPTTNLPLGVFCPTRDTGGRNAGRGDRYYNGCFDSVKDDPLCLVNCTYTHNWYPNPHTAVYWQGCVMDRAQNFDVSNTTPTTAANRFPAENASSCVPSEINNLGYDWTSLEATVDSMVGSGNTNQTIGLAWAWQSLTLAAPLNAPSLPANTTRHLIILSDGENTQNRWTSTRSLIDDRMEAVCAAARADDIIVWAVFVNVGGGAGSAQSMIDCATGGQNGGHYFLATTPAEIIAIFNVIGQQITNLRIAH